MSPDLQLVSLGQLRAVMPRLEESPATAYLAPLNAALREHEIANSARLAAFLAQIAVESDELRHWVEFAHTKAYPAWCSLCKRTGHGHGAGEQYEGRVDLGNTHPGDGPRFAGRGPIQLTGRANYRRAGNALGVDLERSPMLAATPAVGFRIAGWFWQSNGLNPLADDGQFKAICIKVNGANRTPSGELLPNGWEQRKDYWAVAKQVFHVEAS